MSRFSSFAGRMSWFGSFGRGIDLYEVISSSTYTTNKPIGRVNN